MGIRFIYGRAGTGKSDYILKEIKDKIRKEEKIYIITPEQYTFTLEKKLLDILDQDAVVNAEVISFERMAYRVISQTGNKAKVNLSKSGKAMLVYDILDKNKKDITFLGKTNQNVDTICTLITELKKHNVTIKDIEKAIEGQNNPYLKLKLQDIYTIYSQFQKRIQQQYIDENDLLTILYEKLDETEMFNSALIYIDEFIGFTPQEYKIVEKLSKCGKQLTITICSDDLYIKKDKNDDVFYTNKQTVEKLINMPGVKIEKSIFLQNTYRFKSEELAHLEKNIYSTYYKKYEKIPENIKLFLASNQYTEIENVASNIIKLVKDKGYRYGQIAIITKDISAYSSLVKAIFKQYDIPVFIDEKADLGQNILVKYVMSILDIFAKNWSYEAVFNYIKTPFCSISNQEQFALENYCIKYGIRGKKWYKEEWKFVSQQEDAKMNLIREKIVFPLMEFYADVKDKKNVKDITQAIYMYLIKMQIDKKLEQKKEELEKIGQLELSNIYSTSWNLFMDLLDEIVLVFGEKNTTFEKYAQNLKIGLQQTNLRKNSSISRSSYIRRCR